MTPALCFVALPPPRTSGISPCAYLPAKVCALESPNSTVDHLRVQELHRREFAEFKINRMHNANVLSSSEEFLCCRSMERERLFTEHMLTCKKSRLGERHMLHGRSRNAHELYIWVCDKFLCTGKSDGKIMFGGELRRARRFFRCNANNLYARDTKKTWKLHESSKTRTNDADADRLLCHKSIVHCRPAP